MSTYNVNTSKLHLQETGAADENKRKTGYSCGRNLKNYLREYSIEGSLHGLKYVGQKRTVVEKIWWLVSMIMSLSLCIILVKDSYEKWQNTPVIVSFATKETPTWQVPFPAVTICPENKVVPNKFNYTDYLFRKKQNETLDAEIETKLGYLSLICKRQKNVQYTLKHIDFPSEKIFEFFDYVQPNFYDAISECKFMGRDENCSEIFVPIVTDVGICYSFNLFSRSIIYSDVVAKFKDYHTSPSSNWTLDTGYSLDDGAETYPRRALYAGATFALEGVLTTFDEDYDYQCGNIVQGFRIDITHPARIPRPKQQFFKVPLDRAVETRIAPEITLTSSVIEKYDPDKRNCYFSNERFLRYFKIYTQQNCEIECSLNNTIQRCHCSNFYMPRDNDTVVCTGDKLDCIQKSTDDLLLSVVDKKIEKLRLGNKQIHKDVCKCLPLCNSMYHSLETLSSPWNWQLIYPKAKGKHMSHFQIFFRKNQYITMERNELFGITDFLANFGSFLGLFIGFSLLSFIEFIYYFTLRIICNIKMFGIRNWSGTTE